MRMPEMERVTLNLRKLAAQHRISGQLLDDMRLDTHIDYLSFAAEQLVLSLATRVQCHNLPPEEITEQRTHVTREPTSWWQMLKRDHAPKWWLKRWPVRETATEHTLEVCVNLRRFHVYPDAPKIPHDGYQFVVASHELVTSAYWIAGGES